MRICEFYLNSQTLQCHSQPVTHIMSQGLTVGQKSYVCRA